MFDSFFINNFLIIFNRFNLIRSNESGRFRQAIGRMQWVERVFQALLDEHCFQSFGQQEPLAKILGPKRLRKPSFTFFSCSLLFLVCSRVEFVQKLSKSWKASVGSFEFGRSLQFGAEASNLKACSIFLSFDIVKSLDSKVLALSYFDSFLSNSNQNQLVNFFLWVNWNSSKGWVTQLESFWSIQRPAHLDQQIQLPSGVFRSVAEKRMRIVNRAYAYCSIDFLQFRFKLVFYFSVVPSSFAALFHIRTSLHQSLDAAWQGGCSKHIFLPNLENLENSGNLPLKSSLALLEIAW